MFFRPENLTHDSRTSIGTKIICHTFCFKDHITLHLMMPRISRRFLGNKFLKIFFPFRKKNPMGPFLVLRLIGSVKAPEVSHDVLPLKMRRRRTKNYKRRRRFKCYRRRRRMAFSTREGEEPKTAPLSSGGEKAHGGDQRNAAGVR